MEVQIDTNKVASSHVYTPPETKSYSKSAKTLRNATNVSPPTNNMPGTGVSPPIKLRIFKDKRTSKLVSVSDAPVSTSDLPSTEPQFNAPAPKVGKKRGRKPKIKTENTAVEEEDGGKFNVDTLEPSAARPRGRMTRNSTRLRGAHTDEPSEEAMPHLDRSDRRSFDQDNNQNQEAFGYSFTEQYYQQSNSQNQTSDIPYLTQPSSHQQQEQVVQTKLKSLEEDAEFQKLSEMFMEEDSSRVSPDHLQSSTTIVSPQSTTPMNLSNNSSSSSASKTAYSHSNSSYIGSDCPYIPSVPKITPQDNFSMPQPPNQTHGAVEQNLPLPKNARDIRSILEDDWDESFDEESPRKTPGSSQLSTSPPKVSRFDMSALDRISPQHYYSSNQGEMEGNEFGGNGGQLAPGVQQQAASGHQPPRQHFSSSPYAMRNLLSSPEQELRRGMMTEPVSTNNTGRPDHMESEQPDEPENLVCQKQSGDSETKATEDTDSPLCSQESSNGSQTSVNQSQGNRHSAPKKASIFKSRAQSSSVSEGKGGKKRLALYKHKFGQGNDEEERKNGAASSSNPPGSTLFDDFGEETLDEEDSDYRLRKLSIKISGGGDYSSNFVGQEGSDQLSKVTCKKEAKKLFTVVRNVKPIHELQESGEFHEFDGDVWYILEDLKRTNPMTNR